MTIGSPSANATDSSSAPRPPTSDVPHLAEGVQLAGEYADSGYAERRFLVYRADGQAALLSRLLYLVLRHVDGRRTLGEVADLVSAEHEQHVGADGVRFLIEKKLEPLGLVAFGHTPQRSVVANPLLALQIRGIVLPTRAVRAIGRVLGPLHQPAVVVLFLASLVALDTWMVATGQANNAVRHTVAEPLQLVVLLALTLASIVFHEFGHASACHYGGARPGAIGAGLYLFVPCFYTNVTDSYRLNRTGRLRTDLGGVYFNAIFIVAMGLAYLGTGYPPFLAAALFGHLEIMQQLPPLVRLDGYYILGDLIGVPNLFGHVRPILRSIFPGRQGRHSSRRPTVRLQPGVRRVVTGWVLVVVPILTASLVFLLINLPGYAASAWGGISRYWWMAVTAYQQHQIGMLILTGVSLIMIVLPWVGLSVLAVRMGARLSRPAVRALRRRTPVADENAETSAA